ncbi:hypothetical protein E2C00_32470 [Streptomyces sp. WAC05374]|uniref:hypothetical protein n=1 Tax=unclassified Streptomyces TaxID=2593676 RepID=UPI000F8988B6|nr:hypothetical protein [Streptomyces sp. WAC05374]RST19094.1 hypothetical protein EF905_02955 [Streptomyces sp. WAC05374]TDF36938.1 hypothetical protein E2B92_30120 [Streptomyces sp. WAC05374]TDF46433.1 hypothetical protein E2C02_31765 [Streptomyces sp. WAC05374]TDF47534.1 hypothetical protein E2C00_32470 [Streptomyces sp. WAC05374]
MNTTLWLLVACASACTVMSALAGPAMLRPWRVDAVELKARREFVRVLSQTSRPAFAPSQPEGGLEPVRTAPAGPDEE